MRQLAIPEGSDVWNHIHDLATKHGLEGSLGRGQPIACISRGRRDLRGLPAERPAGDAGDRLGRRWRLQSGDSEVLPGHL